MATSVREITVKPAFEERKKPEPRDDSSLDLKELRDFSFKKSVYFQIDRDSIVKDTVVNFGLIRQKGTDFETIVKADSKSPARIDGEAWSRLAADAACEIVIEKTAISRYHEYLSSLSTVHLPENERIRKKAIAIKENSKILMKELLDDPRSGEKIKEIRGMTDTIADSLLENREMIYSMLTLSKYDYYTYTHCVNVSILSIGLGIAAGLKEDDIRKLGIGAMLHDIGKTGIPPELLNKQGRLDEYEYKRIKEHVNEGENILRGHHDIPEISYGAVLQHHEKISGKGYPRGLKDKEIGLFGRISAIADCYDALTTRRPYKPAFTPYEALNIISGEKKDYDPNLLAEFVKMLGKMKEKMN
jgi:HD-GYP domain-containing protein (c-di-GMP phosphodiesterase class II)